MVAHRGGLNVHRHAPGEPARCLLFKEGSGRMEAPSLAIDVAADAIRVIDPNTNALVASASPSDVTATAETYHAVGWGWGGQTCPILVVGVPGWRPLSIGCVEGSGSISWRGKVDKARETSDYKVGAMDWLTLVEQFGLAPYLEDTR